MSETDSTVDTCITAVHRVRKDRLFQASTELSNVSTLSTKDGKA